ncbi:MAG: DNA-binding protein [Longispora sp.]|nr:DNA-binding protein [Longispora sp. (in: high G+C Gram-positive bacteria)]
MDSSPAEWLTLPDVAERLNLPILKVRQLLKDGGILAVRRDGVLKVPVELLAGPIAQAHLPGVLNVLRDAGYNEEEALRWLYTHDESLGGTPAQMLNSHATEVKRRAQAMGF